MPCLEILYTHAKFKVFGGQEGLILYFFQIGDLEINWIKLEKCLNRPTHLKQYQVAGVNGPRPSTTWPTLVSVHLVATASGPLLSAAPGPDPPPSVFTVTHMLPHVRCPSVTPDFKAKTRCSSYVSPGSSCHTYSQNVNTENQCLHYINIITQDIIFTQKTISTLSLSNSGTHPSPQAINWGQHKLLKEIFIVVVHLVFSF
jgi:hypothetical protein